MTMQQPQPPTQEFHLPEPGFPMVTRVVTNPIFQEQKQEIVWVVGRPHPFVKDLKVMRMFVDRGGVEIYTISEDGTSGSRNLIPMSSVRLIEEAMPIDVFVDEMTAAENDDDDEPEDPDEPEEPEEPNPSPAPPPNGTQTAPS